MREKQIVLSPEELEELKDEVKFRTKVVMQLKALSGVRDKVIRLEVHSAIQWGLLLAIIGLIATVINYG